MLRKTLFFLVVCVSLQEHIGIHKRWSVSVWSGGSSEEQWYGTLIAPAVIWSKDKRSNRGWGMVEAGHTHVSGTRPTDWVCSSHSFTVSETAIWSTQSCQTQPLLMSWFHVSLSLKHFYILQHSGIPHVALSSWALLTFGPKVCRDYGLLTFCLICILGGVSGNFMSFLHTPDPTVGGTVSLNTCFFPHQIALHRS